METPPISPPDLKSCSDGSPPHSPVNISIVNNIPGVKIQQDLQHQQNYDNKPVIICNPGTGRTIKILPYNSSKYYYLIFLF